MARESLTPPIILLGNVRSGTSMVQSFFDRLPGIERWFEPRTVWSYAAPGRRHDRFDASDARPGVKKYIRKRFLKRQTETGGRVMEKTPSNVLRAPYVHEIFPECKLIYVIREPLANLSSAEFRWQNPINKWQVVKRLQETPKSQLPFYLTRFATDHFRRRVLKKKHVSIWGVRYPGVYEDRAAMPVEHVIAKQWAEAARICRADLDAIESAKPGTIFRTRYEDIVADPAGEFAKMCAHVGEDLPDSVAAEIAESVDSGRQSKWKRLDPELIRAVLPYLEEEMQANGYEPPEAMPTDEEREAVRSRLACRCSPTACNASSVVQQRISSSRVAGVMAAI